MTENSEDLGAGNPEDSVVEKGKIPETPQRRFALRIEGLCELSVLAVGKEINIPYDKNDRTHIIFGKEPATRNRPKFEEDYVPILKVKIDVGDDSNKRHISRRAIDFKYAAGQYTVTNLATGVKEVKSLDDDLRNWEIDLGGGYCLKAMEFERCPDSSKIRIKTLKLVHKT